MALTHAPLADPARTARATFAAPRLATIGLVAVLACAALARLPRLTALYQWDEADYVQAATLGVAVNWTAQTALPLQAFLRMGVIKWLHLGDQHIQVPEAYDPSRDTIVLAHYHPPLVLYAVSASWAAFGRSEWATRLPSLLPNLLAIGLLIWGAPRLFGRDRRGLGWFAGVALASMPVQIHASGVLSMHPASACVTTAALFALMRFRAIGRPGWLYAAAALAALSLLALDALPVALALVIAACGSLGLLTVHEKTVRCSWRLLGAAAIFLAVLVIGWPGGVLRSGWLQLVLLRAYNVQTLHGAGTGWLAVFAREHPFWALLYAGALIALARELIRERWWTLWWPLLLVLAASLAAIAWVPATILTHGLTAFTLLSIVVGVWLARLWAGNAAARSVAVLLVAAMIVSGLRQSIEAARLDDGARILRAIDAEVPPEAPILADGAHIFRLYRPSRTWVDLAWFDASQLRQPERFTPETSKRLTAYQALRAGVLAGRYPHLILQPRRDITDPALAAYVQTRYRLVSESEGGSLYRLTAEPG